MSSYKLEETLEAVRYRILTERHFLTQEAVVRQRIVDPILEALGWNASELDLVREQKVEKVKDCNFRIIENPEGPTPIQGEKGKRIWFAR
jgi:predicted type IV restriction endonuclease